MIQGFSNVEEKDGVITVTPYYEWADMPLRVLYAGIEVLITPCIPGDYKGMMVNVRPEEGDSDWRIQHARNDEGRKAIVFAIRDGRQGRFEEIEPAYITTI